MKILYASGRTNSSYFQLRRISKYLKYFFDAKIAAYQSAAQSMDVYFNLDYTLNFSDPDCFSLMGDNIKKYRKEIKLFAPDLIISDLDLITSSLAMELGIELWHISPKLLHYGMPSWLKQQLGTYKYNSFLFDTDTKIKKLTKKILSYASCNLVYSYFCDTEMKVKLINNFEWIRPYYILSDDNSQNNILGCVLHNDLNVLNFAKNYKATIFSTSTIENIQNIDFLSIENINQYKEKLGQCSLYLTTCETDVLSDAFYNQKYTIMFPNEVSIDIIINAKLNELYDLGTTYANNLQLDELKKKTINISINDNCLFLHEKIKKHPLYTK